MRYTCRVNRLLSAGALGYVGATPANRALVSWLAAGVAVAATYGWSVWVARDASACALASGLVAAEPTANQYTTTTEQEHSS